MFKALEKINTRPKPFAFYTAGDLWTGEHTSKQMLAFHLNAEIDVSSHNAAFIDRSVEWIVSRFDGFWSQNKYYGFLNTFKYEQEKVILDKYTIVESRRTQTVYNWMQCFSPETLEKEFAECGFAIEKFYSDVAGSSYSHETAEFAVIAKRL